MFCLSATPVSSGDSGVTVGNVEVEISGDGMLKFPLQAHKENTNKTDNIRHKYFLMFIVFQLLKIRKLSIIKNIQKKYEKINKIRNLKILTF